MPDHSSTRRPDPSRRWADGPPLALPGGVDAVARWWGGRSSRERLVVMLAVAVLLLVTLTLGARRGVPGPPRPVLVVQEAAPAGTPASALVLRADRREADGVSDDAIAPADGAAVLRDRRLSVGLLGGEVLRAGHLRPGEPHEQIADGRVAVVVELASGEPPAPGDRVDLLDTAAVPSGAVVAAGAVALARDVDGTWFDVARGEAPGVASASAAGTLALARLPP